MIHIKIHSINTIKSINSNNITCLENKVLGTHNIYRRNKESYKEIRSSDTKPSRCICKFYNEFRFELLHGKISIQKPYLLIRFSETKKTLTSIESWNIRAAHLKLLAKKVG